MSTDDSPAIVSLAEALQIAENKDLDIVLVSETGDIPTCKMMDYKKFMFEQTKEKKKKDRENRKKAGELKEINLKFGIADNDIRIKTRQIVKILGEGDRVRVTVFFKGRTISLADKECARITEIMLDEMKDTKHEFSQPLKKDNKVTFSVT